MTARVGSLCTGYGGLDGALTLAGLDVELEWVADNDRAAGLVLARRHPGVPNLGDITAVNWSSVPAVDILTAGFPCQPFSEAGQRRGADDDRHLWPHGVLPAIQRLRPPTLVLENVPGLLTISKGAVWRQILADLDLAGYTVRWTTVGACAIGAAHCRHRIFAHATLAGQPTPDGSLFGMPIEDVKKWPRAAHVAGGMLWDLPVPACGKRGLLLPTPSTVDAHAGVGAGVRRDGRDGVPNLRTAVTLLPTPRASDGTNGGPNQRGSSGDLALPAAVQPARWGQYAAAVARHETAFGTAAPDPTEPGRLGAPRLSPAFVEWLMCLPAGHVTDLVLPMTDPRPDKISRSDALRLLGNGVIPAQAAVALQILGVGACHDRAEVAA